MLCFHHHQHKLSYIMYIQPLLRKLTFRPLNQKKFMYTTKFKNIFFLNFAFISNTLKDLPHITNENCAFFIYFFLYACHDRELYFMICMSSKKKYILYIRNQHFTSAKYTLAANSRLVGHWRWLFWRFICYFRLCMLRVIFFWFSFPLSLNEIFFFFKFILASAQNKYLNNYNWQRNCVTYNESVNNLNRN